MYRLRKKRPPFGTEESPILEYAYTEQVKVVNGLCDVENEATRDYLLKMGYEEIEVEDAVVAPSENGSEDEIESPVPVRRAKQKTAHRRGRR